jgi:hypothetical protein
VVTGDDAAGRGVLLADGEPTKSIVLNGTRITRLWEAPGLPAALPLAGDPDASQPHARLHGYPVGTHHLEDRIA